MKTTSAYLPFIATLALSVAVARAATGSPPRGVSPTNAHLYVPDNAGQWRCLDGLKTIPFSAVNDDYCDCKGGSDEPGTSACGNWYFHCANVGHIGLDIKTSRVNDGVCDPQCCDGSDEYDGTIQCPNVCDEVGAKDREEKDRVKAVQEKGSRLRKEYIQHGKAAKAKLREELEELKTKTEQLQKAVANTREKLDAVTEKHEKILEGSKAEREAARKVQLTPLVEEQSRRLKHAKEVKDHLLKALHNLKQNHNKNYHDLAVKNAVSAFVDHVTGQGGDPDSEAPASSEGGSGEDDLDTSSDERLKTLTDDINIALREIGALYDLLDGMRHEYNTEYNDEAVLAAVKVAEDFEPHWNLDRQEFKDELPLEIPEEEESSEAEGLREEVDLAQQEYDTASNENSDVGDRISDINRKLQMDFGPDETFAELLDQCFEHKDHEYTYSFCFFGEAKQQSQTTTNLGKFSSWDFGNVKRYDTQLYTGGTKCWNGPERSVRLELSCGESNEIISVSEPSKCEYLFKMQTPAVCPVLPEHSERHITEGKSEGKTHDEL